MEQKVKAGDYVILDSPLDKGKYGKVLEVYDNGNYITLCGGGITSMYRPITNKNIIRKAKVKTTGEDVTVVFNPIEDCYNQVVTCDEEKNDEGREFSFEELDFSIDEGTTGNGDTIAHPDYGMKHAEMLKDQREIDWEQRRYEIAKEMMPYCAGVLIDVLNSGGKNEEWVGKTTNQVVAEASVSYADALIAELKKRN